MGKVSPKENESKVPRQKRRTRSSNNKYSRPKALAQLQYSKASSTKSCTDLGKKRIVLSNSKKGDNNDLVTEQRAAPTSAPVQETPVMISLQSSWILVTLTNGRKAIRGKSDRRSSLNNDVAQLDPKTGVQLKEALQLQLDVQRRLHEQLEIQRKLQLRIEEQGKQLKMMFDQQQKTRQTFLGDQNSDNRSPNGPSFSLDEVQVSSEEGSGCDNFHSKIS